MRKQAITDWLQAIESPGIGVSGPLAATGLATRGIREAKPGYEALNALTSLGWGLSGYMAGKFAGKVVGAGLGGLTAGPAGVIPGSLLGGVAGRIAGTLGGGYLGSRIFDQPDVDEEEVDRLQEKKGSMEKQAIPPLLAAGAAALPWIGKGLTALFAGLGLWRAGKGAYAHATGKTPQERTQGLKDIGWGAAETGLSVAGGPLMGLFGKGVGAAAKITPGLKSIPQVGKGIGWFTGPSSGASTARWASSAVPFMGIPPSGEVEKTQPFSPEMSAPSSFGPPQPSFMPAMPAGISPSSGYMYSSLQPHASPMSNYASSSLQPHVAPEPSVITPQTGVTV